MVNEMKESRGRTKRRLRSIKRKVLRRKRGNSIKRRELKYNVPLV